MSDHHNRLHGPPPCGMAVDDCLRQPEQRAPLLRLEFARLGRVFWIAVDYGIGHLPTHHLRQQSARRRDIRTEWQQQHLVAIQPGFPFWQPGRPLLYNHSPPLHSSIHLFSWRLSTAIEEARPARASAQINYEPPRCKTIAPTPLRLS